MGQGLDAGGGPGGGFGDQGVEAALDDRKRVAIGRPGSRGLVERRVAGARAAAAPGDPLDEQQHLAQLRELTRGVAGGGFGEGRVAGHAAMVKAGAAKEALTSCRLCRAGAGSGARAWEHDEMRSIVFSGVAAALAFAAPAAAQVPVPGTGLTVSGEAELMSDYRFRGISRSDEDPAGQANVTLSHASGLYVGTRATTLSGLDNFRLRDPSVEDLGDVQLDLYAGYSADLGGGVTLDGGLMYTVFAGDEGQADYAEPYASLSYLLGPVEATAGVKYAPSQRGTGDEDMLYLFGELEAGIPFTPIKLRAHAGRQDWGDYGSYTNWSLGGSYTLGPAELGLRYVDTSLPSVAGQDAGLVLSLGVGF